MWIVILIVIMILGSTLHAKTEERRRSAVKVEQRRIMTWNPLI
jgi:hypothetical protein